MQCLVRPIEHIYTCCQHRTVKYLSNCSCQRTVKLSTCSRAAQWMLSSHRAVIVKIYQKTVKILARLDLMLRYSSIRHRCTCKQQGLTNLAQGVKKSQNFILKVTSISCLKKFLSGWGPLKSHQYFCQYKGVNFAENLCPQSEFSSLRT